MDLHDKACLLEYTTYSSFQNMMARDKKYCSVFSLQCDSCLINSIFDFVSPMVISPIKGVCEKWGGHGGPYETSKLRIILSLATASLITIGFSGYLPVSYTACNQDRKECLQLLTETVCCLLGIVATYTQVVIPYLRINNMHAWYRLIKKCKLCGYYKVATGFQRSMKGKVVAFKVMSFILPAIMTAMRQSLLRNKSFWLLRIFGLPFNIHLQLVIIFRHILVVQFMRAIYRAVQNEIRKCLVKCTQSATPKGHRSLENCNQLRELNRLYSAVYFNSTDFAEHISSRFTLWFGAALLTLIVNIYSIVLLSDAQEIVQEALTLKCQTLLLIVIIIYSLKQIQHLHDVVSDSFTDCLNCLQF